MAKKARNGFYSISTTNTDFVLRITKRECFNEDGDKVKITLESNGAIFINGLEAGTEEFTLEEFIDYVEGDNLTDEEPLFFGDEEVFKVTDKSGNVTSITIGCETYNKKDALELMKKLNWIE